MKTYHEVVIPLFALSFEFPNSLRETWISPRGPLNSLQNLLLTGIQLFQQLITLTVI